MEMEYLPEGSIVVTVPRLATACATVEVEADERDPRYWLGAEGFFAMCEEMRRDAEAAGRALPLGTRAYRRLRARLTAPRERAALRVAPWLEPE